MCDFNCQKQTMQEERSSMSHAQTLLRTVTINQPAQLWKGRGLLREVIVPNRAWNKEALVHLCAKQD